MKRFIFALVLLLPLTALAQSVVPYRGKAFKPPPAAGGSSFSEVQQKTLASATKNTSHTLTFDTTPTVNNLQVVCITADDYMASPPSGWTQAVSAQDFTGTYIIYRVVPSSPSASVTVTLPTSVNCNLTGFEYSGCATASPLDVTASAIGQGVGNTISTGTTATTAQANEILVAVAGISSANATFATVTAWSNSFVEQAQIASTGGEVNVRQVVATLQVSATGAYTSTATLSGGENGGVGAIATFKITTP